VSFCGEGIDTIISRLRHTARRRRVSGVWKSERGLERQTARTDRRENQQVQRKNLIFVFLTEALPVPTFPQMKTWGKSSMGLVATIALVAILPATASAANTISVNSEADAPLKTPTTECKSTEAGEPCTLRAAVELADQEGGSSTIELPTGTYTRTANEVLAIDENANITLLGGGQGATIIDGAGHGSVFEVEEEAALTLKGVTLEHGGDADEGGAVFVSFEGALTVEDSTLTENEVDDEGGAIYGQFASSITVKHSTLSNNKAGQGGAIYGAEAAMIVVQDSTITGNHARRDGGGIYGEPGSAVTVENSTVSENVAEGGDGGGIFGGDEQANEPTSTVHPDQICVEARPSEEPRKFGGVTVKQSTIEGNSAQTGDDEGEVGDGGGIYVAEEPSCGGSLARSAAKRASVGFDEEGGLDVEQSTIAHNSAEEEGGGIFEDVPFDPIVNSTIAFNTADDNGGGVYAHEDAFAELISDTVYGNEVKREIIETKPALVEDTIGNNLATGEEEDDAAIALRNTIVAEPRDIENCEGTVESLTEGEGFNLDFPSHSEVDSSIDTCGLSEEDKDLPGVEPGFETGELEENGGPTQTIALASTSAAIGVVALNGDCQGTEVDGPEGIDQRGLPRPGLTGRECDIGAYEYQGAAPKEEPKEEPKQEEPKKEEPKNEEPAKTPVAIASTGVLPFTASVPKACTSLRDITIHIQNVKQFGIVSAVISIDGHSTRKVQGKHLRTAINLRGLPKGTFTVEIVAHQRNGHILRGKRVYHTCHTKLPGHARLPL
jgi:predicted outer membrane repeat protein